jgi:methionyl-tRNA formyltransferase
MRFVLIGQAAFGEKVLQALLQKGEQVVGVYVPFDTPRKPDPLKEAAKRLEVPVFQPRRTWGAETYAGHVKLEPDLNVMAFVTDILPLNILNYPKLGTIQYHPSLLPKHRGGSAINWAIINGDTKTGVTIFWPDEKIDTGPILLQKEVDISPDDTVGSLYFNKLSPLGVEALMESIELIRAGKAHRIPQDESQATYEALCTEKEAVIDWSKPAHKVYNLIRGTNPRPGATTCFRGKNLKIFESELLRVCWDRPSGEVAEIAEKGITVSGKGGAILVKRVQPEEAAKINAFEYAQSTSLRAGDRFGPKI